MDNLVTIAFEAHHAGNNHHRRYEVSINAELTIEVAQNGEL